MQFAALFLPHLDAAYNLARHLLRDADAAEDLVQDAYLRALRHAHGFRGENPRAWLLTIVRRTFYSQWQRERAAGEIVPFDETEHVHDSAGDEPDAALTRSLTRDRVDAALAQLPAVHREVLVLRELETLSYEEIGRVTGVPLGTVMSRLSRARARLRAVLAGRTAEEAAS